jgi:hypothetical protein
VNFEVFVVARVVVVAVVVAAKLPALTDKIVGGDHSYHTRNISYFENDRGSSSEQYYGMTDVLETFVCS